MDSFDREGLRQRLISAREKKKLNQAQLAEKASVTPAAISQIEKGSRTPTISVLDRIASALDVSIDFLLGKSVETDLKSLLQDREVKTFCRGFSSLDSGSRKTIMDNIEFLQSKNKGKAESSK